MSFQIITTDSIVIPKTMKESIQNVPPSICLPRDYYTNINGIHIDYQNALINFVKTWFDWDISDFLSKDKIFSTTL